MVLQHRIHLVSRYPHTTAGCAAAVGSTSYCATIKKKKDRSCTGRHKTQHALMHMATHFFFIWRHPPFQTRKYLPVYNFISLSSQPSSSSSKRKEKVLVAFFENISVANIFFKKKCWRDINISLYVPKALLDAGGTAQGNRTCPDCVGVQAYNNLPSILPVVSGSLPRRPQSSCNG